MNDSTQISEKTPEQSIREEFEKTASLINGARRLMTEGRTIDLSAVEERVRSIINAVNTAPPEIAASFKDHLEALLGVLDTLETDLNGQHKAIEDSLEGMKRREAVDAYGSPPVTTPSPKQSDKT